MSKLSKTLITAGCTLALLGAGCASGGISATNQTSPEKAVSAFLQAVQDKNKAAAQAYVDQESDLGQNFDEAWDEISSELNLQSHSIVGTNGNDVRVELKIEENGEVGTETETLEVVEKDGKWWVVDL